MEDMKKLLLGYRDNIRVEVESGVAVTAQTAVDLRALPTWPEGLVYRFQSCGCREAQGRRRLAPLNDRSPLPAAGVRRALLATMVSSATTACAEHDAPEQRPTSRV